MVLDELYFGPLKSQRPEANLKRVEEFAAASNVLPVDAGVARLYGKVRDGLRRIGRPIPENDLWIAATTLRHDLVLVTRDSHFEGLRSELGRDPHNSEPSPAFASEGIVLTGLYSL